MNNAGRLFVAGAFAVAVLSPVRAPSQTPTAAPESAAQSPATQGSAAASGAELAEVVVTAEKQQESVQKAPLTIQVLDSAQVVKSGITSAADLNKLTTGVDIGSGGANTQIFIRGVGGLSFSPISTPGVAFNVDGVDVGRPNGVNGNFYDLERVEVLKGPQGTLYGRNANGGSINLITKDAELNQESADLHVEAGNFDLFHASGGATLPLGNTAAIRAAFNVVHRNGYLSNGADDDIEQSGRIRFKWEPSDAVTLRASADYSHQGGMGSDYVYSPQRPGASPWEAQTEPAANLYVHGSVPLGGLIDDVLNDDRQNIQLFNVSSQLDVRLGDFATLTVLPAYRRVEAQYVTHFAGQFSGDEQSNQESAEVRLGNSTEALTWVAGAYYFREASPNSTDHIDVSDALQNVLLDYSPTTSSYAAFGQATVTVVDHFRLIGGIRYTTEIQDLTGTYSSAVTTPPTLLENFGGNKRFTGVTYKAGGEYDLTGESMVFATYSTGFKAGGFNQTVSPNTYSPEKLKSTELGSRNRFFDNRLQLNLGLFHWKYSSIQDQRVNFDPLGNVNFITFNSGDATLYGANLDIAAKLTPKDTVRFSAEFDHSRYDSFYFQTPVPFYLPGSAGCRQSGPYAPGATLPYTQQSGSDINNGPLPVLVQNCSGFQVARVPKWSSNLAYAHDFSLPSGGLLTPDAAVKYQSASWVGIDFIPSERQSSYAVLDANLTYSPPSDRWSIGLFGRNLASRAYYTGGIKTVFVGDLFAANIGPPRTYGIQGGIKIGD